MSNITRYHSGIVDGSLDTIRAYLPPNYHAAQVEGGILIFGKDECGWTFDDYVIPRLASGLHFVRKDA